jgi:hypothetical protein
MNHITRRYGCQGITNHSIQSAAAASSWAAQAPSGRRHSIEYWFAHAFLTLAHARSAREIPKRIEMSDLVHTRLDIPPRPTHPFRLPVRRREALPVSLSPHPCRKPLLFVAFGKRRPRARLTIRQRTRVVAECPHGEGRRGQQMDPRHAARPPSICCS